MKKEQKVINGILLLDKPLNMTSNGALQRAKRLLNAKKAGHTGSLDPLATGMLPICFGEATKFSQFLLESNKSYLVEATLGAKTTTGDAEGKIIAVQPVPKFAPSHIETLLRRFEGSIQQVPPMYSAIKFQGKPLYELARKGLEVARAPRTVNIYRLRPHAVTETSLLLDVHCSKGTYIRTLVEDIGDALGCGAHVSSLRRTLIVPYQQEKMLTFDALEQAYQQSGADALRAFLLPIETAVQTFPAIKLSTSAVFYLQRGQAVMAPPMPLEKKWARLYNDQDEFIGVGELLVDGRIAPRRLIHLKGAC